MAKKLLILILTVAMMLGVFGLAACESINRVTVEHESITELQTSLPDLYYFDFETEEIEVMQHTSYAILNQSPWGKKYEHFGYRITYNIRLNTEVVVLSIVGYKHNNRDFVVNNLRISSEYQNATQREDFIEERTIDEIQCMIYGNTTMFFWTNQQQYTITIHKSIEQDSFTIDNFIEIVEPAITNKYKI